MILPRLRLPYDTKANLMKKLDAKSHRLGCTLRSQAHKVIF